LGNDWRRQSDKVTKALPDVGLDCPLDKLLELSKFALMFRGKALALLRKGLNNCVTGNGTVADLL
jgi:hypothetical protein